MENVNAVKAESKNEDREGAVKGIKIHGVVYAFVSALLATINLTVSPETLWFMYPALGMGIGMIMHIAIALKVTA